MEYKVLYRKYRPTNFDQLVGQENIVKILRNSVINNKIAHAYIFTGPRGTGKTSTAKIFAKVINCENPENGIPCEVCTNCKEFLTSPDIIEIDAASNSGVDNIRGMIENVGIAPSLGKYKIYIIDEVHMLSKEAWNAFLKTLEEPPANVIFILATTEIQDVPMTILSRCQRFDFQRIDRNLIFKNLARICDLESIKYTEDALKEVAFLSDGCMRDALSILDQLSKVSDEINIGVLKDNYGLITNDEIEALYTYILKNDLSSMMTSIESMKESGLDIKVLINKMLDVFLEKAITLKQKNVSTAAFKQLKKLIESLNGLIPKLNYSANGYLLLELELLSYINDEDNKIISREIINLDTKFDVNSMINKENNKQIYNICDEFINIRINNTFVAANKDSKVKANDKWNEFKNVVKNENLTEFFSIIKSSALQVASDAYIIFVTSSISIKTVANSKLFELETKFNTSTKSNYKLIFISKGDWDEFMKNFDKSKKYTMQEEKEYINEDKGTIKTAENLFGNDNMIIE